MIYKIITNFNNDLDKILQHFQKDYVIMFYRNAIYIANLTGNKTQKTVKTFVSKVIKDDFYLQEINENNLKYEPPQVIEWCKQQFVRLDTLKFEEERQEELRSMLSFVRAVESNIEQMIQEQKGG